MYSNIQSTIFICIWADDLQDTYSQDLGADLSFMNVACIMLAFHVFTPKKKFICIWLSLER